MHTILLGACTLLLPMLVERTVVQLKPPVIESSSRRAPDFEYRSLDGSLHNLSDLNDKVVLFGFWGTSCPGCVEEMPTLQRLYEDYRSDPTVAFAIVSQYDSADAVKRFVKRHHLTMPIYYIGIAEPPTPLAPSARPATFFVSPDGVLRGLHLGGAYRSGESVRKYIEHLRPDSHHPKSRRVRCQTKVKITM